MCDNTQMKLYCIHGLVYIVQLRQKRKNFKSKLLQGKYGFVDGF